MRISKTTQNKIKLTRILQDKKTRIKENKFVIEGIHIIESALNSGIEIDFLLFSKNFFKNEYGIKLINKSREKGIECIQVSDENISEISQVETSQGIVAVSECKSYAISQLPMNNKSLLLLILDAIQDPGNVGTIIRIAESSGAHGIILSKGCVDIYNPKTIRGSMGAIFNIPIIKVEDLKETIKIFKKNDIKIIATDNKAKENYFDHKFIGKIAFLLGNEAHGLKSDLISQADSSVKIPILGKSESLNVATAAGIIIFERIRQNWKNLKNNN